jgi:hypothetical protein
MATKTLQQKNAKDLVTPNANSAQSSEPTYAFFSLGDTAYFLYNGVQLPVVIRGMRTSRERQADGGQVVYTVVGHVGGSTGWTSGTARGPFVNVPGSLLTTR